MPQSGGKNVALRIDYVKRTIALSAADLLGGRTRRIGYDRGDTFERLWIGQAVHRRVQGDALATVPGYEIERAVRLTFPVEGFTVTFEGRLDGRYEENGRVIVDEVKSLHFEKDLAKLAGSPRLTRFELQLRWYLLAVAEAEGKPVEGRLVLADIESGATRVHPVVLDAAATKGDLLRRVRVLLAELDEAQALAEAKAAEAETLTFPFATYRPGQHQLESAVARAAAQGDHLLVEAPTGIGKTAATLVPLVVEALRSGKRLYVLTSKTTQQEIFTRTLEAMGGDAYRSVRLRAKERMCANDVVLCHEDHCAYARDYGAKMAESALLDRLMAARARLEPDFVFEEARREAVCPFEVSLELSEVADVVVGDYNYVFDPIVALSAAKEPESLAGSILLIDEAHNLVDRGRGYYSPEIHEKSFDAIRHHLNTRNCWLEGWEELIELLRGHLHTLAEEVETIGLCEPDRDFFLEQRLEWERLVAGYIGWKIENRIVEEDDPLIDFYFKLVKLTNLLAEDGEELSHIVERTPEGIKLKVFCKDP
ncbi:MAG TPA: DEAD/DEAH box helicase, partial [Thermoanaerobaculia bacterium]|nr:DEAD/DEAH box helicase [Thermoanaerobaculia bacterium]